MCGRVFLRRKMNKKELFMKYALHTPYNFNVNVARALLEENEKGE
jgi:hypothetical protein